ncbi:hypothetical protein JCGZ_25164 [Jatropha curcas]|uniref:Aminotransferase-like plant mobile domain-containing protein n=1 Tax=Jatropha curcas TaxID=180498 RepID=A0A067JPY9_JATCU|nr:hypothetical protein JCGZ_25164 [Jatropha curcas]
MKSFISYGMQRWTKRLAKVEKINLSQYGMASLVTLIGLPIDRAFLDACLHLWDPQAHAFRFDTYYKEMCPTYEEFAALLGNDFERASMASPTGTRFFKSFMRMLGLPTIKMERGAGIASMALAETILSLNRAYRVDGIWSASPILL